MAIPFRGFACLILVLCQNVFAQTEQVFNKLFSWPPAQWGQPYDVVATGARAYVAMGEGGIAVVDISNPNQAAEIGRLDLPSKAMRIKVYGNHAYLGCGTGGIHIVNVQNPSAPVLVGTIEAGKDVTDFSVNTANVLFVSEGNSGIAAFNVTNPANPTRVGSFDTDGYASGVESGWYHVNSRRHIFVADGANGFLALDVHNPATITQVFRDAPEGRPVLDVAWDEWNAKLIYVSSDFFGTVDLTRTFQAQRGNRLSRSFARPRLVLAPEGFSTIGVLWEAVGNEGESWNAGSYYVSPTEATPTLTTTFPANATGVGVTGDLTLLLDGFYLETPSQAAPNRLLLGGAVNRVKASGNKILAGGGRDR